MGGYNDSSLDFSGKNITIWGNGKILDPLGEGRIFWGSGAGSCLTLHEVVLQNGISDNSWGPTRDEGGGAIHAKAGTHVEIYDCIFKHNAAGFGMSSGNILYNAGGAIYAQGADVQIYTSTFEHNNVGFAYSSFFAGGAVYVCNNSHLQIHDTTFHSNGHHNGAGQSVSSWQWWHAGAKIWEGGAVSARDGGILTIYNSTFSLNMARTGGAVYASTDVEVKLHACSFYQNIGGQIWFYDANVEIHDATFDTGELFVNAGNVDHDVHAENSVVEIHTSRGLSGLAVYAIEAKVIIHNTTSSWVGSTLVDNFVGQIYAEASNITIRNSAFEVLGGYEAIRSRAYTSRFIDIQGGNLEIYSSEFKHDIILLQFIVALGSNVAIYTSSFEVARGSQGGSIFCAVGSLEIHDSTFQSTGSSTKLIKASGARAMIHNSEFSSTSGNVSASSTYSLRGALDTHTHHSSLLFRAAMVEP
jgi:hypothetical protein